jgi:GNAT superfamily N-acetyltransferase
MRAKFVSIRVANVDDWESIAHLHHLSHSVSFRKFADQDWVQQRDQSAYREFWKNYLGSQPSDERTWLFETKGEIKGIVTIMNLENSSEHFRPSHGENLDDAEISCLRLMYVHPDFERQGIGTELMSYAMRFMREQGYRMATLITHATNTGARQFYEAAGWELDTLFDEQVEEFFEEPRSMRQRARYVIQIN